MRAGRRAGGVRERTGRVVGEGLAMGWDGMGWDGMEMAGLARWDGNEVWRLCFVALVCLACAFTFRSTYFAVFIGYLQRARSAPTSYHPSHAMPHQTPDPAKIPTPQPADGKESPLPYPRGRTHSCARAETRNSNEPQSSRKSKRNARKHVKPCPERQAAARYLSVGPQTNVHGADLGCANIPHHFTN